MCSVPSFSSAKEGGDSSGGGLSVVCFDNPAVPEALRKGDGMLTDALLPHIISVTHFDLYEAMLLRGGIEPSFSKKVIEIGDHESAEQYAQRILKRLKYSAPELYRMILKTSKELNENKNTIYGFKPLERMNDARQVGLIDYENCMYATMALNHFELGVPFLEIDKRIYQHPKHSEQSRGILLLHEYIYLTARKLGHKDSRHTRVLIDILITDEDEVLLRGLITKLKEFRFSGDQEFDSYSFELIRPIVHGMISVARLEFMKFSNRAQALVLQANIVLKKYGTSCPGHQITPCLTAIWTLKNPELTGFKKVLQNFTIKRTQAVSSAMLKYYEGRKGKAKLSEAPGLPKVVLRQILESFEYDLFKSEITTVMTDGGGLMLPGESLRSGRSGRNDDLDPTDTGGNLPGLLPLNEIDLEKLVNILSRKIDRYLDYPIEVVR